MSLYHGYRFEEGSISDYADIMFHYRLGMHIYICVQGQMLKEHCLRAAPRMRSAYGVHHMTTDQQLYESNSGAV